jgi:hypothetical protein
MQLYCYMTMLLTMSPYSFSYVLVLFPRYHNGPNPSHRHTHLMISVDPSESFGSALCQRYTPHSRQSLLLFTDPYVSKHTHTRWVHARSTELILQFARALLRAHRIFAASLCAHMRTTYMHSTQVESFMETALVSVDKITSWLAIFLYPLPMFCVV